MKRLFILMATLLATLTGAAQTFGDINLPQHLCAGTVDTISFGINSEYNIVIDTATSSITRADCAFLPDGVSCNGSCSYTSPITFSGFAQGAAITSVNDIKYIRLNMEHSYIGDIYIGITCPTGVSATLMNWSGGGNNSPCAGTVPQGSRSWSSGNNTNEYTYFGQPVATQSSSYPCDATQYANRPGTGWNYCWSNNNNSGYSYAPGDGRIYRNANSTYYPSIRKTIVDSSNVAAGTNFYHPDQSFSNLIGCPINGQWTISVIDAWSTDNGYIFEWEMSLTPALRPTQCDVDTTIIVSPYVQPLSTNSFVISVPPDITADTTIFLSLLILNNCGDTIDSLVPIHLHPDHNTNLYDTACDNYRWYGHTFTSTTVAQIHRTSRYSCDSLLTLNLQINHSDDTTIIDTILENNLPYISGHDTLTTSGIYIISHETVNGCDSTVNINLTVWPNKTTTVDTTLCRHQLPLLYNGNQLTTLEAIDTFVFNLFTTHGADSTVYLVLTVLPDNDTSIADTIVQNSLPWSNCGLSWLQATDTTFMRTNRYNCDSIVHYSLTVWPNITTSYDTIVCDNYLPLTWKNHPFTAADTVTLHLQTQHGADSTVTLSLAANPAYNVSVDTTLCDNQLPFIYLGSTIQLPQTLLSSYTFNLSTMAGCDSIVTLNLTVLPTSDTAIRDTVVQNNLPVYNCGLAWQQSTDTVLMRTNMYNCDSTIHYNLVVWPNIAQAFDTAVCANQLPLSWNNHLFNAAETVTLDLQTHHGADSTVTLSLTVNPVYAVEVDTTLCDNQLPLIYLDSTIQMPLSKLSSYTFNLTTTEGCDSIVTLFLTVLPTTDTTISDTVVQNDLPHYFRGTAFNEPGSWQFHTLNTVGCDSTINYSLHVWLNDTLRLDTTVCSNHTPFLWHGASFTSSGTTVLSLHNTHGADSIVILRAYIPPAYDTSLAVDICDNEYYLLGRTPLNTPGHYDTLLFTRERCDSVVHLDLAVHPTYSQHFYDTTCRTSAYQFLDAVYNESGVYTHNLPTVHGCDSLLTLHLALKGILLRAESQIIPIYPTIENKHINLRDVSHHSIDRLWLVGTLESHQKNISIDYPEELDSLEAMLIAYSDDGCADTAVKTIRMDRSAIFAPNAFTPNESDNSHWSLIGQQIATLEVWIYNREGLLVYHYDDVDGSWDGTRMDSGTPCQQGAYVYRAQYTTQLHPSRTHSITGTILLIR